MFAPQKLCMFPSIRPLILGLLVFLAPPAFAETAISLEGRIVDQEGQPRAVADAAVFVLGAESGLPVDGRVGVPASADVLAGDEPTGMLSHPLVVPIDPAEGTFRLDLVPGRYRLFAQRWPELPEELRGSIPGRMDRMGTTLELLGTAEVTVGADGPAEPVQLRPSGSREATLTLDPDETHGWLVLSERPPLGPVILGISGWHTPFRTGVLGVFHVEDRGDLRVTGLPDDETVFGSCFFYDNSPGIAGGELPVGEDSATWPLYAGWGNAKKWEAPERLAGLAAAVEAAEMRMRDVLPEEVKEARGAGVLLRMIPWLERDGGGTVDVPGIGEAPVLDVLSVLFVERAKPQG